MGALSLFYKQVRVKDLVVIMINENNFWIYLINVCAYDQNAHSLFVC